MPTRKNTRLKIERNEKVMSNYYEEINKLMAKHKNGNLSVK